MTPTCCAKHRRDLEDTQSEYETDVDVIYNKLLNEFGSDKSWYSMYMAILKYVKKHGCVIPQEKDLPCFYGALNMIKNSINHIEKRLSDEMMERFKPPEKLDNDLEAGIHCESYVSNPADEPGDRCRRNHPVCEGKYCKDYRQAITEADFEPLPYRPKTRHNQYGELRLKGVE